MIKIFIFLFIFKIKSFLFFIQIENYRFDINIVLNMNNIFVIVFIIYE